MDDEVPEESSIDPAEGETAVDAAVRAEREIANAIREKLPEGNVPLEELASVLAQVVSVEIRQLTRFRGPLPPPDMLAEYEKVIPGLGNTIVERANKEQAFRHETTRFNLDTERKLIWHQALKTHLGQGAAFILAFLAIGGGLFLIYLGKKTEGLASIISPLVALVAVFITGKIVEAWSSSKKSGED